ncbi:PHB depolymerase family esterase [Streptomyces sp. N35]|uniref:extracellular catalytic domain type 1 short-chain-length polyhydroxyalkanoate depolymerase n=1 Tax=Streptomyces sp. N35 TaxID=2795730 RepID=UPI0027DE5710|nr:PHB depolymerase family esterase [Streptomyces sp. N35]
MTLPHHRPAPRRRRSGFLLSALAAAALSFLLAATMLKAAPPARAASIEQVTGFGSNPGALKMYRYVPDGLPAGRPLVVAMHGCSLSGTGLAAGFGTRTGWKELADRHEFTLVLPETGTANNAMNCFNWFKTADITRDQGEALSIKQMVDKAKADQSADPSRVYVTGLSAGGGMTSVVMAAYPEVFAGGGIAAGLPYGCAPETNEWTCMSPGAAKSPAQWGDKVRAASPGGTSRTAWPTLSVWHGTGDTTVVPANLQELVDQWTNVHGADQTADVSDTVSGAAHKVFKNLSGRPVVESFTISGMGHGQPIDPGTGAGQCGQTGDTYIPDANICSAHHMARFWGLAGDGGSTPSPDPTTPSPGPSTPAPAECFTSSNYTHVQQSRAHQSGGYAYADGSNQPMGLWNTAVRATLRKTGDDHYEVVATGSC